MWIQNTAKDSNGKRTQTGEWQIEEEDEEGERPWTLVQNFKALSTVLTRTEREASVRLSLMGEMPRLARSGLSSMARKVACSRLTSWLWARVSRERELR